MAEINNGVLLVEVIPFCKLSIMVSFNDSSKYTHSLITLTAHTM